MKLGGLFRGQHSLLLNIGVVFVVVALGVYILTSTPEAPHYPEVKELSGTLWSFQQYADYMRRLGEEKGAPYAFEVLKRAEFASGTDLHLLGHVVGDLLYKQQGIEGVLVCTQDFRNACSHSVVIGILNEHGLGALPKITDTCKRAPGGSGAYTMCFHGLGHGVLAYAGYNLEEAIDICKRTGTEAYHNREYIECVGGAVMEMIAGVHDPQAWAREAPKYLKESDPLSPCNASFMPEEVRGICYTYLTPHLFTSTGVDLGSLTPSSFPEAFSYCRNIPETERVSREACFGGFGKEFIVYAQGRDIRRIDELTEAQLRDVRMWCSYAGSTDAETWCNSSALSSLFWGGENDTRASFAFCALSFEQQQPACYEQLAFHISTYLGGSPRGARECAKLPPRYQRGCTPSLGL